MSSESVVVPGDCASWRRPARRTAERVAEEAGRKAREAAAAKGKPPKETGGPEGLEPTRYGDWEKAGRCIDF